MKELTMYQLHLIYSIQHAKNRLEKPYDHKGDFKRLAGLSEQDLETELDQVTPKYLPLKERAY
jgi:hypothetical protein